MTDEIERLKKMQDFNRRQEETEPDPVHWEPVSNIDKEEQKRQEIIKAVEDHHKMSVDLWLSHLKGRGR